MYISKEGYFTKKQIETAKEFEKARKKLNKCNLILNVNNGTLELYNKKDWDKFDGFPNDIMFKMNLARNPTSL